MGPSKWQSCAMHLTDIILVTPHTALGVGGSTPVGRGHYSPDSITLPRVPWPTHGTPKTSLLAIDSGALPFLPPVTQHCCANAVRKHIRLQAEPDRETTALCTTTTKSSKDKPV